LKKGLFIVLEGVEGAGKSTQSRMLSEWFRELGLDHILAREPGGTPVGEAIRSVVLDRDGLTMPGETELFLILAARAAFVRGVVLPALEAGRIVLSDRFDFSTLAYQGFGRELDLNEVRRANAMATGGLKPDLCLVLDVPVELGLQRKASDRGVDRIEGEGSEFLSRVREGYLRLVEEEAGARLVHAAATAEAVQVSIRGELGSAFPETFPSSRV
jgi:dTMP kinase